ncbi:MAG: triphosphoribosyl-dephospho-CoA synthase [Promethearchaeota archaeon]
MKDKVLLIDSIEDILRCANLASLLELSGYPKPGNVHRNQDFVDTRFEHFLAGITAIQPNFKEMCERIFYDHNLNNEIYKNIQLGVFFKDAAEQFMKWQKGGNVILGHILILAPLVAAATICLKKNKKSFEFFIISIKNIIDNTTIEDSINLYEAIRKCDPGGLGKVDKYDINDENSIKNLKIDRMNLKKIFEFSKDLDLISHEYSTGFNIILNEGLPYYFNTFKQTSDINIATVNTFLKILAKHHDTLIIKKSGLDHAIMVSEKACEIINVGGIISKEGLELTKKLDLTLHKRQGKLNPGTTADLVAGVIFCALLCGLRY